MDVPSSYHYNLISTVKASRQLGSVDNVDIVEFDELGRPVSLLGCCHHFDDADKYRRVTYVHTLMNNMIERVKDLGLSRPKKFM